MRIEPAGPFEMFADAYPHEAAEMDWEAFTLYVRRRSDKSWTDQEIRDILAEDDAPEEATP